MANYIQKEILFPVQCYKWGRQEDGWCPSIESGSHVRTATLNWRELLIFAARCIRDGRHTHFYKESTEEWYCGTPSLALELLEDGDSHNAKKLALHTERFADLIAREVPGRVLQEASTGPRLSLSAALRGSATPYRRRSHGLEEQSAMAPLEIVMEMTCVWDASGSQIHNRAFAILALAYALGAVRPTRIVPCWTGDQYGDPETQEPGLVVAYLDVDAHDWPALCALSHGVMTRRVGFSVKAEMSRFGDKPPVDDGLAKVLTKLSRVPSNTDGVASVYFPAIRQSTPGFNTFEEAFKTVANIFRVKSALPTIVPGAVPHYPDCPRR